MAKRFARYALVGELGRGGQAVVHEAFDPELGRAVALKVLLPGVRSLNSLQRFQREARAAARLTHPNIISVYDVGEWQGRHYISMELVEGGSLEESIASGRMPVRDAVDMIRQLADAAHSAHEQGIVHRDIKPANILVDTEGRAKLADFGFALDVDAHTQLTQTGAVMGTPAYMPPEQARGRAHAVDARGDVYSLGAVLYEMLTGRPPFEAESSLMLLNKIVYEPPKNPSELRQVIPQDAATIALKCLEKEPGRRYQTAAGLQRDCERFLAGESISARRASFTYHAKKTFGRHRGVIAASVMVMLALAGVGAWVYLAPRNLRARIAILREETDRYEAEEAELRAQAKELLRKIGDLKRRKAPGPTRTPLPSGPHDRSLFGPGGESAKAEVGSASPKPGDSGQRPRTGPPHSVTAKTGERPNADSLKPARAELRLSDDDTKVKEVAAEAKAEGKLAPLMAKFDSLVNKRAYAAAKRQAERAARDPANAGDREALLAAARVAGLLENRQDVIRRAAEARVGLDITVRTKAGNQKGRLVRFDADSLVLAITTRLRGGGTGEAQRTIAWKDLLPESEDEFAAEWRPEAPDGAVARAYVALGRKDPDAAERALASAQGHLLASLVREKIDAPRRAAAEAAASREWDAIRRASEAPRLTFREGQALLSRIEAYRKKHGRTEFIESAAESIHGAATRIHVAVDKGSTFNLAGHASSVLAIAFSPDGTLCAIGTGDGNIAVWDVAGGGGKTTTVKHAKDRVRGIAFSTDGQRFAAVGSYHDDVIRVWDVRGRTVATTGTVGTGTEAVAFSADGALVLRGGMRGVLLYNAASGKAAGSIETTQSWVRTVCVSPNGAKVAAGDQEGVVKVVDLRTKDTMTLSGHRGTISSISFSADGRLVLVGTRVEAKLWDSETGNVVSRPAGSWAVLSRNGKYVLALARQFEGPLNLRSVENSALLWATSGRRPFALSPNCRQIAFCDKDDDKVVHVRPLPRRLWPRPP